MIETVYDLPTVVRGLMGRVASPDHTRFGVTNLAKGVNLVGSSLLESSSVVFYSTPYQQQSCASVLQPPSITEPPHVTQTSPRHHQNMQEDLLA